MTENKGDLISREALKNVFEEHEDRRGDLDCDWRILIDNAPTVEPAYISDLPDNKVKDLQELAIDYGEGIAVFERKRPQGEWTQSETDRFYHTNNWKCSNCHSIYVIWNDPLNHNYNFCPNCGAEMVGGES